jgi:outer membrane protein
MKRVLFFIVFFGSTAMLKAQPAYDLNACISKALENNISLKQSALNAQSQEQTVIRNKGQMLPNLNGFASHSYNWGQRIDPFTNQFANSRVRSNSFSINTSFTLFQGFQVQNQIKKSIVDYRISQLNVEETKNNIVLQVASMYLQVLLDKETVKSVDKQQDITAKQLERTMKMKESGQATDADISNLQSQLANEQLNLINAQNRLQIDLLSLKQLLLLDTVKNFDIVTPEISENDLPKLTLSAEEIYSMALSKMPQIKKAELQIESSEKDYYIAKAAHYPTLSLSGSWGTGYSGLRKELTPEGQVQTIPFTEQFTDNLNQNVGLNLSVPIFNRFATRTSVSQTLIGIENSKLNYEQAKQQLRKDVFQAYADAQTALKKYEATKMAFLSAETAYLFNEKKFQNGLINFTEFATSKNNYQIAELNYIQAKYEYLFKMKVLDFYYGTPISL